MRRLPCLAASLLLAVLTLTLPRHAQAGWDPGGTPVCAAPGFQNGPAVAPDGSGGAYVAWSDRRNGFTFDVYVQRIDDQGNPAPGWPVNGIPVCTAAGNQLECRLVPDATGAIVVWSDGRSGSGDIYAHRVTAFGTLTPGWPDDGAPLTLATGQQYNPRAVSDGAGGAIVVWTDQRTSLDDHDCYAQHITVTGALAPGWPADGLGLAATTNSEDDPWIVGDGAGGAFLAWDSTLPSPPYTRSLRANRFTGAGTPALGWPAGGRLLTGAPGVHPVIAADGLGGIFAAWQDVRDDPEADIFGSHVRNDATLDPAWPTDGLAIHDAVYAQFGQQIIADGVGGAIVAWSDNSNGADEDVRAMRLTAAGTPAAGWPAGGVVLSNSPGWQDGPQPVSDGSSGAFFLFQTSTPTDGGLLAQHLDAAGVRMPGWPSAGIFVRYSPPGGAGNPTIAATSMGNAIAAWADDRSQPGIPVFDIYATLLGADGPVAVLASLVSATVDNGRATLVWQMSGGAGLAVKIERREGDGAWMTLADAVIDGSERISYEDATIQTSRTYGYRLSYVADGRAQFTAEARVEVPALALAIRREVAPSSTGGIALSITMPRAAAATLDLIDVGGRRVASRDVGSLGAGTHRVLLDAPTSGMYLARLRQGNEVARAKVVVTR